MRIGQFGRKHYTQDDEVIRLEMRGKGPHLRLVAILTINENEVAAEIRPNLNRCGIQGEPITQAFEGFLRKHRLERPRELPPKSDIGKLKAVAFTRRTINPSAG